MNRETIFTVRNEDLARLNQNISVEFFQKLLWAEARRFLICSLVLCPINAELIALTFCLTPPPRLTYKKYYILQDGIDFRGFLPLLRLHALRFIRSVALQAIFLSRSGLRKPCTTTWRPVTRCQ